MYKPLLAAFVSVLALAAAACSSSTKGSTSAAAMESTDVSEWLEPNALLNGQIELRSNEVEVISSLEDFVRLSDWFQNVGEPAYPKLLEMASSSSKRSREFGLSVIAANGDARMLEPFKARIPVPSRDEVNHRYEYARALLRMGDISGAPYLIEGLEEAGAKKRAMAYNALLESTQNNIPFDASGTEEERAASVAAWRQWYAARSQDPMLRQ